MTSRARSLTRLATSLLAISIGTTGCINPVGSYTGMGVVGCPTHALEIDGLLEMTSPTTYIVTGETLTYDVSYPGCAPVPGGIMHGDLSGTATVALNTLTFSGTSTCLAGGICPGGFTGAVGFTGTGVDAIPGGVIDCIDIAGTIELWEFGGVPQPFEMRLLNILSPDPSACYRMS